MRNIAEFRIIGNVVRVLPVDRFTRIDIASNYNRKDDSGEWQTDTHYNSITAFGTLKDRIGTYNVGDLVHITGRVRQNTHVKDGSPVYTVDLIADAAAILTKKNSGDYDD